MKGKIDFNDIMRIIMFHLSLINADRFHMPWVAFTWMLVCFFLIVYTHPSSFIHLILTIYTAFCLLGSLPTWSLLIILYTRPASPIRPSSHQQSSRNPHRVTSAHSIARKCYSCCLMLCGLGDALPSWPLFGGFLAMVSVSC